MNRMRSNPDATFVTAKSSRMEAIIIEVRPFVPLGGGCWPPRRKLIDWKVEKSSGGKVGD